MFVVTADWSGVRSTCWIGVDGNHSRIGCGG